jgi:hypothetical protein
MLPGLDRVVVVQRVQTDPLTRVSRPQTVGRLRCRIAPLSRDWALRGYWQEADYQLWCAADADLRPGDTVRDYDPVGLGPAPEGPQYHVRHVLRRDGPGAHRSALLRLARG